MHSAIQKLKQSIVYLQALMLLVVPAVAVQTVWVSSCPGPACVSAQGVAPTQPKGSQDGDCSKGLSSCDLVSKYLNPFIRFLSAFVGVAVVISIIIGGIQYGSSAGDPQKVSAAKNRIRNAIIALVTFIFLDALLNFLIPGGLL